MSSARSDRGVDECPAKFNAAQPDADGTSAVIDDLTGSSARLGQQLQSVVAGPESDSARALEVLKQARQRLSDAHQYQMKMALQAATEAAERQVREATQAANRRHEQLAAQARQAHVKHDVHSNSNKLLASFTFTWRAIQTACLNVLRLWICTVTHGTF